MGPFGPDLRRYDEHYMCHSTSFCNFWNPFFTFQLLSSMIFLKFGSKMTQILPNSYIKSLNLFENEYILKTDQSDSKATLIYLKWPQSDPKVCKVAPQWPQNDPGSPSGKLSLAPPWLPWPFKKCCKTSTCFNIFVFQPHQAPSSVKSVSKLIPKWFQSDPKSPSCTKSDPKVTPKRAQAAPRVL